jgi:mannitol 2-dehydrogenase
MKLDEKALTQLPAEVAVPEYDRGAVSTGIVHVGVGGFHRGHEAVFVDRLLASGETDWAICGVGLLPPDRHMRDVLAAQDHLYTVVERGPDDVADARVVGSLVDYLYAPDDPEAVIERMADPTTRIVSLTITEGGYLLRPDGSFDASDAAVRKDLEPGASPTTVFAFLVEALHRRRDRDLVPFTVLSCDNLEENGQVAQHAVQGFAELRDPELAAWIAEHVSFPNNMVDRITPVTTDVERRFVAERFGIEDAWPVVCEPYLQWVLTDDFPAGRPPWESVGVMVVPDVRPYELMKLRLLNASHQVMGYLGSLAGFTYVHEACQDPQIAALLTDYMEREATPTLDPVPGVDLDDYRPLLLERFTNEAIADTLARQCVDGSERLGKFVLPVLRAQLESGGEIERTVLAIAAWARYAEGTDDEGQPLEVVDVRKDQMAEAAARQHDDPLAMLSLDVFDGLRDDERFTDAFAAALTLLHEDGARGAMARVTGRDAP